jgi:multimeric flavodoxin WrbA
MKIVAITGSPRKNGNTAKVLGFLEKLIGDKLKINNIRITSHQVNGCLGCNSCQKEYDKPGCIQKDDALSIFERMMQADFVIYASPLYCWGFSAQIKALIDRHFCMVKGYGTPNYKSFLDGKRVALLVTCNGPIENNADLIQGVFERVSEFSKCNVVGKYIVPFCINPDTIDTKGIEIAKTMASDILESLKI